MLAYLKTPCILQFNRSSTFAMFFLHFYKFFANIKKTHVHTQHSYNLFKSNQWTFKHVKETRNPSIKSFKCAMKLHTCDKICKKKKNTNITKKNFKNKISSVKIFNSFNLRHKDRVLSTFNSQ